MTLFVKRHHISIVWLNEDFGIVIQLAESSTFFFLTGTVADPSLSPTSLTESQSAFLPSLNCNR